MSADEIWQMLQLVVYGGGMFLGGYIVGRGRRPKPGWHLDSDGTLWQELKPEPNPTTIKGVITPARDLRKP